MESNYNIAAAGLAKIRMAKILSIVASVLTLLTVFASVGVVGAGMSGNGALALGAAGIGGILLTAIAVLGLISLVLELVGLSRTTGAHADYKTAMLLVVGNIVLAIAGALLKNNAAIYNVVSMAGPVLGFLVVLFIINGTVALLLEKGDQETAGKGVAVRTIYLVCMLVNLASLLVGIIPALAVAALVALVISSVVQVVALFMYIGFLGRSVQSFTA